MPPFDAVHINEAAINGVILSTGDYVNVKPGTFHVGRDPLFLGAQSYTFTTGDGKSVRCGLLNSVVQFCAAMPAAEETP